MRYDEIDTLRRHHPAWRLLRADNAPLVLGFLGRVFVEENARSVPAAELTQRLDDELYELNHCLGAGTFPKPAKAYLDSWSSPEAGWLRKYYPVGSEEAHFDATPEVEKALSWLAGLQARSFVGTESRLNTIMDLLQQLVYGAETDPELRLADLERRRAELEAEIARVRSGDVQVMDTAARRDRYQQFTTMARELLSDFREVEANFRALDRELRERIASWRGSKGELLDDIVGTRSSIAESDQGRSFHAFYDFLLSQATQEKFADLLERVQSMEGVGEPDPRMRHVHHDWLEAGERTQATVRLLSEQLRRFLDDRVWLENRRVIDLLRGIENRALALREHHPVGLATELDAMAPPVVLPMERPLYQRSEKARIDSAGIGEGERDVDVTPLFEQVFVDREQLALGVRRALQRSDQVALREVVERQPIEHGLAELVGYLSLGDPGFELVFDERVRERLRWRDEDGRERVASVPAVTYVRVAPDRMGGAR